MKARFVVITGLSGSGKSSALRALEDVGYYAVDNLPVELLPAFVNLPIKDTAPGFQAALGMDVRAADFVERFPAIYNELCAKGVSLELLFLEAGDEALVRRFSQTRRQHPLAMQAGGNLGGISRERELLLPIRQMARLVLDTSRFTIHELRREIFRLFTEGGSGAALQVNLLSFGFKYGIPLEADLMVDVRFIANPYFREKLRPLDGRDRAVVDYVIGQEATGVFLAKYTDLLDWLLPLYEAEGKTQLTVAVGCTGGRHRSVVITQRLAEALTRPEVGVTVRHRDINLG